MSVQKLDLRSLAGFCAAVEWIRREIILHPSTEGFYEIEVATAENSACTIFMNRSDAYLVAFRGQDRIYALADPPFDHARALVDAGLAGAGEIQTLALTVSHASLGTLDHTFTRGELQATASLLNGYSARDATFERLRKPISLLVCVLAEAARSPAIAFEFQHLWTARILYDRELNVTYPMASFTVRANEAIQCYDKAIRITTYANRFFPQYIRPLDRLTKLEKRAAEIRELLQALSAALISTGNRQLALNNLVRDPKLFVAPGHESAIRRLHDIARELHITRGDELTDIAGLCGEQVAMDFARSGVVARDLAPPRS